MVSSKRTWAWAVTGVLAVASVARAQTGPDLLLRPLPPNERAEFSLGVTHTFGSDLESGEGLDVNYFESAGRVLLDRDSRMRPIFGVSAVHLHLDTDSGLPDNLGDYSVAVGFGIFAEAGWVGGLTLGVGYASAQPFGDGNALYGKATLAVARELESGWFLGLALDFDGNRNFMPDVPLPGFVLRKRYDEYDATISIGFPVTGILWEPTEQWDVQLNYVFPDFLDARVTYFVVPQWGIYGSVAQRTDAFHWNALEDGSDRLFFKQRRAELGVEWNPRDRASLILAGGYAFSQEFTTGFDSRGEESLVELDDAPYARIALEIGF
jgi:hypothetical protein